MFLLVFLQGSYGPGGITLCHFQCNDISFCLRSCHLFNIFAITLSLKNMILHR